LHGWWRWDCGERVDRSVQQPVFSVQFSVFSIQFSVPMRILNTEY
jgi:hypothetical protein